MLELHKQPLKTLYLILRGVVAVLKLPVWLALSALPWTRQRRSWDFTRSFAVRILKELVPVSFAVLVFPPQEVRPAADARGDWVWVEPVPHLVAGEVLEAAAINGVESVRVYGCMQALEGVEGSGSRHAEPGERIIYYIHGDGYICREWIKEAPTFSRAFLINYRFSQGPPLKPANPFPAALIDALAGYNYLVHTLGFAPQNIILAGESAGAHLALVLTRYLVLNILPGLAPPRALMLASPVADWGRSHVGKPCWVRNEATDMCQACIDYVPRALLCSLSGEYVRTSPWFSPGSLDILDSRGLFRGLPPTLVIGGGAEILLDPIRTLRDRLVDDLGEAKVEYLEVADSLHAFIAMSWHEPERSQTNAKLAEWSTRMFSAELL
ncbi:hypothetical protein PHLGIDRAFT_62954 [Phlebiopsis gigantea 11061_1 CR5-6]|uniref:Alpha/beta hydrolase fold-3 domain-containing protein n=1 Tax=Phlebiopsis gigantea (strain 11061_1 CR5-6) TaxID=745531 RepID=A0A0C3PVL4_PHLG1|nr:hypothetical protein PHLGIDRAFT_62954 [Phlebiopsis gigantea 11061_1 CR5-6]